MKGTQFLYALGSTMGLRLATSALNFGLFWALAHLLDTELLGGFSLLTNVFLMVQLLPLLGLTVPLMRRAATAPETIAEEITNAFAFAAPISVLIATAIGVWGQVVYGRELSPSFWLIALSLLPNAWTIVAESALLGQERIADVARVNLIEAALRIALALASARTGHGLTGVFVVFLSLRILVALLYLAHPCIPAPSRGRWRWETQKRNWREVPIFLSIAIAASLVSRLDVITLSHLRGLHDVAVYSAASRLYDAAQMLPTVIALIVLPTLSRQFIGARAQFRNTLGLAIRVCLLIGLASALFASSFARPLVDLLYRQEMSDAAASLRWFAFAAVIMLVDVILSSTMMAANAQKHDLYSLLFGLFVLAVSLVILIPDFGPAGAAASVSIGLTMRVLMRLRWMVRELELASPWFYLLRVAIACAAGLAAQLAMLPSGATAAAFAAVLAYILALLLLGVLGRHPLRNLHADITALVGQKQA